MNTTLKTKLATLAAFAFVATASAFYNAEVGRWLSRDPIGDQGFFVIHTPAATPQVHEPNVYGFVRNRPISDYDYLGLFCCNGKWYNPFTHCCLKDKIVKSQKIDTGVKVCSAPTQTQPKVDHSWLEGDGWSAGFYPNGATDGTLPGQVVSPDNAANRANKQCDPIRLNPCVFDIDLFKSCLQKYIRDTAANPPIYDTFLLRGGVNCHAWRINGVGGCQSEARYYGSIPEL